MPATFTTIGKLTVRQVAGQAGMAEKTVRHWIDVGIVVHGRRVQLQAVKVGGRVTISEEALLEFQEAINGPAPTPPESEMGRQRRFDAAKVRLRELGVNC